MREAGAEDHRALALLRALWTSDRPDAELERRMADWLAAEGERRTTWLAELDGEPVGMATMLEYRRMPRADRPDSRWGYLGNMFVREDRRNRGIGAALLRAIIATADARGYARIVLSPSLRSIPFYRRAGFIVPDETAGDDRLLVRPGSCSS